MDYSTLSVAELKAIAKEKNLKGISALKKEAIIALLVDEEKKEKKPVEIQAKKSEEKKPVKSEEKPVEKKAEKPVEKSVEKTVEKLEEKPEKKTTEQHEQAPQPSGQEMVRKPQQAQMPNVQQRSLRPENNQMRQRQDGVQRPNMRQRPEGAQRPGMAQRPEGAQRPGMAQRPEGAQRADGTKPQQAQTQPQPAAQSQSMTQVQMTAQSQPQQAQSQPQAQVQQPQRRTEEIDMSLDSGLEKEGILEVLEEGYGFIRCDNFMPGNADVYVSSYQLRKYGLRTGDVIKGNTKVQLPTEKFAALLYIKTVNGHSVEETQRRRKFENLTPIFPNQRLHLENPESSVAMRMVDLIAPVGKGQRGMIVSQPKSGKTTLLKQIAKSITKNHKDVRLIILLIDERPEEVTDMKDSIKGEKVEVIYSTFDEEPAKHQKVSNMVLEHAKRLVEYGEDVVILVDSLTRMARACNLTCSSSGRTLSGGLDPAALGFPKKFFGAARNMREGGSLTVLATALVETGSRMDDVVFEEFKGTGNMELVLNRDLSERRIFPAIDLKASGTRREDLLLTKEELEAMTKVRRALNGAKPEDTTETLINMCAHTRNNFEFVNTIKKTSLDGRL